MKPTTKSAEKMDGYVETLHELRDQKKQVEESIKVAQTELLALMEKEGVKQWKAGGLKASRVQASSVVTDEKKLATRLGIKLWTKVSTRRLDKKKLDALISAGEVDIHAVAACSTEKLNAPFIRID